MAKLPLSANHPPANHLLAALSPDVLARVSPELDVIPLKLRQFVHKAGEPIREVYSGRWVRIHSDALGRRQHGRSGHDWT